MISIAEREKTMPVISSKTRSTSHANVFGGYDTMGWSAAAFSVKGVTMSVEQNFEGDAQDIRRSSTVKLKRDQREGSPDISLLTFEKESQAYKSGSRYGRLGPLNNNFLRVPPQRRHCALVLKQKGVVSTYRCPC